ncbi:MAG: tetratricopeptide repeat protein [Verrucomicrobia bacterium]|nr:tetratricopeptide repeat protein [Verrucomicrobiota bacterium]
MPAAPASSSRRALLLAACGLVVAAWLAFHNSFAGVFVLDDEDTIVRNVTIRQLWPLAVPLSPPDGGVTTSGRPLANLSFALNYAAGGLSPAGYHAVNLAIHVLAGLTLFGLVRRTLLLPALRDRFGADSLPLAFIAAALWLVHPLQTESVTYVAQRTESLMGLFYLAALYAFVRGVEPSRRSVGWFAVATLAAWLGALSKEVIASLPVVALLYDRTFVAGSFRAAWRLRRGAYLGLATVWIPLAVLVAGTGGNRGATIGFGTGVSWTQFALTQFPAIAKYLGLVYWPHPLVFDYGTSWVTSATQLILPVVVVVGLGGLTLFGLWRRPAIGFLGVFFFAILAPTSLLPGIRQTMAEHRVYLALVPVIAGTVAAFYLWVGRRGVVLGGAALLALTVTTIARNEVYRGEVALWSDTVAKNPRSPYAHTNLGYALSKTGRAADAIAAYEEALRLEPRAFDAAHSLALVLVQAGRPAEAVVQWEGLLRAVPGHAEAHYNLGNTLVLLGRPAEAVTHYEAALRVQPAHADAHTNLGNALLATGQPAKAAAHYETALRLAPGHLEARINLGNLLAQAGRLAEAIPHYEAVLRVSPGHADAHCNLGNALLQSGHPREAVVHYQAALRARPDFAAARANLDVAKREASALE